MRATFVKETRKNLETNGQTFRSENNLRNEEERMEHAGSLEILVTLSGDIAKGKQQIWRLAPQTAQSRKQ